MGGSDYIIVRYDICSGYNFSFCSAVIHNVKEQQYEGPILYEGSKEICDINCHRVDSNLCILCIGWTHRLYEFASHRKYYQCIMRYVMHSVLCQRILRKIVLFQHCCIKMLLLLWMWCKC